MKKAFDLNNITDFKKMCSGGELTPQKSIEQRNLSGSKWTKKPFINHAIDICKNNNTNLLDLLTDISDDINVQMYVLGNNNPSFKRKVNNVISEWPDEVTYDDLFNRPTRNTFNYGDLLKCNQSVIDLNGDMSHLESLLKKDDNSVFTNIKDLQKKCAPVVN